MSTILDYVSLDDKIDPSLALRSTTLSRLPLHPVTKEEAWMVHDVFHLQAHIAVQSANRIRIADASKKTIKLTELICAERALRVSLATSFFSFAFFRNVISPSNIYIG